MIIQFTLLLFILNIFQVNTGNAFYCSAYCSNGCVGIGNTKCGSSCQSGGSANSFIRTGGTSPYTCQLNSTTYGVLYEQSGLNGTAGLTNSSSSSCLLPSRFTDVYTQVM